MAEIWPDEIRVLGQYAPASNRKEAEGASLGKCREENQGLKKGVQILLVKDVTFFMVSFQIK